MEDLNPLIARVAVLRGEYRTKSNEADDAHKARKEAEDKYREADAELWSKLREKLDELDPEGPVD